MDWFFRLWLYLFQTCFWLIGQVVRVIILCGKFLFKVLHRTSDNYGTARWARHSEIKKAGLLGGAGPIIGSIGNKALRYNDKEGHMTIFAPTRTGKGTSQVIPTILDYPGSMVILDPKGENYAITNEYRRTLGPVYRLNLENQAESDWYNPLDMVRLHTVHEIPDAENLAEAILIPEKGHSDHWRERAKEWLSGMILHLLYVHEHEPASCNLMNLRKLVNDYQSYVEDMNASPCERVREIAKQIGDMGGKNEEAASFISNINKGTRLYTEVLSERCK